MLDGSGGRPGGQCVGLWHLLQVPVGSILVLEFPVFRDMYYSDAVSPETASASFAGGKQ